MAVAQFVKYHGLGNDFIFIEDFGGNLLPRGEMLAQTLCHRQFGIGADGLVFITKQTDLYTMRIFNVDGTEAEMCGNAIRCMAHYLLEQGLAQDPVIQVGTVSGVKEIRRDDEWYVVDMGEPDFSFSQGSAVEVVSHDVSWTAYPVSMGNPHAVVFVDDLSTLDFATWGPRLETARVWPNGANIEFTQVLSPNHLRVKVWERGAGPTLACGTGACAAAVMASRLGLAQELTAGAIRVSLPGGVLAIHGTPDNHVFMAGPAVRVFSGSIDISKVEKERKL
jgi:diaminopimelate epimerase